MTEYFRITGLNNINFDEAATGPYRLSGGSPPAGMSEPLSDQEVLGILPRLPLRIRPHVLEHGLSIITCQINIQGGSDTLMEQYRHDLSETLEAAGLFIETRGARGTRAVLRYKMDNVVTGHDSYKTIFYGTVDELAGRDVLGSKVKESFLQDMKLTLYCEPHWRPETAVVLGPNEIYCPSFEENADSVTNGLADNWTLINTPTATWDTLRVLHGCYSQKLVSDAVNEGIDSTPIASGAVNRTAVAYAWVHKALGGEVRVQMCETGVAMREESAYSTPGWETAVSPSGHTWKRIVVSGTMPSNANHHLRIIADDAATTFYVDKCYWEWDTLIAPDEWIGHRLIYNHYDARWLPNKAGGAGAGDAGHINYIDVDDLKGDVDARLYLRTEWQQAADEANAVDLIVARQTRQVPCSFPWWLEAEDATEILNWAHQNLARCSGGRCRADSAAVTVGTFRWGTDTANLPRFAGNFRVYGAVYTDDKDNTQYRMAYQLGSGIIYNKYVWQQYNNEWELIYLGDIYMDAYVRSGLNPYLLGISIEYKKQSGDTVKCDCIWLVPKTEPQMRLDAPTALPSFHVLSPGQWWAAAKIDDFDYLAIEEDIAATIYYRSALNLRGGYMTLQPNADNRLYFACISFDHGTDLRVYEAHGAATPLQMIVSATYLPQYISPLE